MPEPELTDCQNCGARVRLPVSTTREEWHCPQCGEAIQRGPKSEADPETGGSDSDTYRIARPKKERRKRRRAPESYAHSFAESNAPPGAAERAERDRDTLEPLPAAELDQGGMRRRERLVVEEDPPPTNVFFSNVFGFPWQGSVIGVWLVMAGALAAFSLMAVVIVMLYAGASSMVSAVAAFIILPAFWVGAWAFSYCSAASLVVIEETAAGNNEIRDWMDPEWKDWMGKLFYVLYVGCLPIAIAWPIIGLSPYTYEQAAIPLIAIEFVFFPIALLSAMEQDSMWMPISGPIVKSLGRAFGGWVVFFVLTGLVLAAACGLTYASVKYMQLVSPVVLGPLWATTMLIYARLLGRLGWLIVDRTPGKREKTTIELPLPAELP